MDATGPLAIWFREPYTGSGDLTDVESCDFAIGIEASPALEAFEALAVFGGPIFRIHVPACWACLA